MTLDLGTAGRTTMTRDVGAGATVTVQVSRDNATWRTVETLTFPPASASVAVVIGGAANAYRYVRITSATAAVALEFEISAAR